MKKILITLFSVLTLLLAGCAGANNAEESSNTEQKQAQEVTITLVKDSGEEVISEKNIEIEEGETLMEVMARNFELTTAYEDAFIVGIDGIESDDENSYYWTYTINGEEVFEGPRDVKLKADDKVEFNYSKYEG
ncbi:MULTISPECIES: DUF4430 domain-containing protein [Bacillus]|uniref:DUF4430 domain-containing protein n=1 Tax=Bacillus TaxID=1386 RepID=UPI000BB8C694|nr:MULTISPECIES: DUF4430 domain-containing protein [Bacillus]